MIDLQRIKDEHPNCSFCEDPAVAALIDTDDGSTAGVCRNHFDREEAYAHHLGIMVFEPIPKRLPGDVTDEQIAEAAVALQLEGHGELASIVGQYVTTGKSVYRVIYVDGYDEWHGSCFVVADDAEQAVNIADMRGCNPLRRIARTAGPFPRTHIKDEYLNRLLTTTEDVKGAVTDDM